MITRNLDKKGPENYTQKKKKKNKKKKKKKKKKKTLIKK